MTRASPVAALGELVGQGLGEALVVVLPLVFAALGASVLAGWVATRLGLQDPTAAAVLRGVAVLGVLVMTADGLAERATRLTVQAWSQLPSVGRAER